MKASILNFTLQILNFKAWTLNCKLYESSQKAPRKLPEAPKSSQRAPRRLRERFQKVPGKPPNTKYVFKKSKIFKAQKGGDFNSRLEP